MGDPTSVVTRVAEVVKEAAARAIGDGRATLSIKRLSDLHDDAEYDCPVVVLSPLDPDAARVVVEVQDQELWWVNTDAGPGTELYAGMKDDRYALLGALVRAVVAGRYFHGPCTESVRGLLRTRRLTGWTETYITDDGQFASRHFGLDDVPGVERRFAPY
jgi:hypothetical protein